MDDKAGILYATDTRMKKVIGIDIRGDKLAMSIGSAGEFNNPSGIAFDEVKERLYVSDSLNHAIRVYDRGGKYLFTIGKRGVADGEFNFPTYLAFRNGKLYVADTMNYRIQILDGDGKFLKKFGQIGDSIGSFSRPKGLGVDSEGHIYVVDPAFNAFQIFDEDGHVLLSVGQTGRGPGEFDLPSALYVDKRDRIYVSDTFNRRIQVFQYLK
jgi:DNA-binding beta-propeller fold protein YncE